MHFLWIQKVKVLTGVAQAATQTTPENERVHFIPNNKSKNKTLMKNRSNSKIELLKTDSVNSSDSKDSQPEVVLQEPK